MESKQLIVEDTDIAKFASDNFDGKLMLTPLGAADLSNLVSKKPNSGNFVKLCSMLLNRNFSLMVCQTNKKAIQILREKGFKLANPECLGTHRPLYFIKNGTDSKH